MADIAISGVNRDELAKALSEGRDHGGNRIEPFVDREGGWPLRCCLEDSQPGDEIAIIAWSPFSWKGAYAETGPVVVHTGGCAAPKRRDELPPALDVRAMTLRPYGIDHRIAYGQVRHVSAGGSLTAHVRTILERPDIEMVHGRNETGGCFSFVAARR